MNILVTGSNGFIGSHVAKYLHDKGHLVIGLGRRAFPANPQIVSDYVSCDLSLCNRLEMSKLLYKWGGCCSPCRGYA